MIKKASANISKTKMLYRRLQAAAHILLVLVLFLLIPGRGDVYGGDAKYIILMIGDGWGQKSIESTNKYTGSTPAYQTSPWIQHWMSTFPSGSSYSSSLAWSDFNYVMSNYGDSASCATALYTGQKTANGRVSVSADASTAFFSIGERAKSYGMAVGAVSTVPVSHATPGAWVAHNDDRSNTYAIADEGFFGDPNTTGEFSTDWKYGGGHGPTDPAVDVLIGTDGSGYVSSYQLTKLSTESGLPGKHVLVQRSSGVDGGTALMNAANLTTTTKLAGLFDQFYVNANGLGGTSADRTENPTLSESAQAALKVLNRNPNGFVFMVEGGAIDWAAHANNMNQLIGEQKGFDDAVQTVIDWVNDPTNGSNWSNTLVIVTGDHDCGYLTAGTGIFPNQSIGAVNSTTISKEKVVSGTGGRRASWEDTNSNDLIDTGETVYWYWNSGSHTNSLIPLYARGTGSELLASYATNNDSVRGAYLDDTKVFEVMAESISTYCNATGSIAIVPGQTLYGNSIDLTSIVATNDAANLLYSVRSDNGSCTIDPNGTFIDTENYTGTISQGTGTFVPSVSKIGFYGTNALRADQPGSYSTCPAVNGGLEYEVYFSETGTYRVWTRSWQYDNTSDSVFVGLDGNCAGTISTGSPFSDYDQWVWTSYPSNGTNTIDVTTPGRHKINIWVREPDYRIDGIYLTKGTETPTDGSHGVQINPVNCFSTIFTGDQTAAQSVITAGWSNGIKEIQVSGEDVRCITPLTPANGVFTFDEVVPDTDALIVSDNTAIASTNPIEGDTGIVMQRFRIDASNLGNGDNQVELTSLSLSDEGTAASISNAYVFISLTSSSTLPPAAVLIGETGTWDGLAIIVPLSGGTAEDRTVTVGTSKYVYIVYDTAPGQSGNEIQSSVSTVFVAATDLNDGPAGTSNVLTINTCIQTGEIYINPGQMLFGNPIDLTSIVNASNAANMLYSVTSDTVCNVEPDGTFIQAEVFNSTIDQGTGHWSVNTGIQGYLGTGYIRSYQPGAVRSSCPAVDEGKEYVLNFLEAGTYKIWLRSYSVDDSTDSTFVGLDGNCLGSLRPIAGEYNHWTWANIKRETQSAFTIDISTSGVHTLNLWVREPDYLVDGIYVTKGTETPNDDIHGTEINSTTCNTTYFAGNEIQAQSIDTTSWDNGVKDLRITGEDATCHTALPTASDTFTYDRNRLPLSAIIDPTEGQVINDNSPNPYIISGTASDEETVNHIEVSTDGGLTWTNAVCPNCPAGDISPANPWTYDWTLPVNDTYTLMSRAVDNKGAVGIPTSITVNVQRGGPVVSSTTPINNATAIVADSTVTINWDRNVDCTSITDSTVTISPLPTSWSKTSCSGSQAVFTPTGQALLTAYTVNVTTGVKDSVGNYMAAPYQFSYTTGEPTPPASAITDPTNNSKINSSAPNPYIISGTASDNDIVQGVKVRINGGAWTPVTTCTGCGTDSATWTYSWALPVDGFYTIESQATDASNNSETPAAPINVEVDRTSPSVNSTNPANGATAVALNQSVSIEWNTNINCATVNTSTITSNNPNWALFGCGGNTAFFTTSGQSEYTLYTVTVKSGPTGVKSSTNVQMSDDYVFTYRTNKAPSLTIHEPNGNDSVKAGEAFNIIYTFDDPDHDPTVSFFYDTDTDMAGGTPIAGNCTGAAEGTNAVCTWNISAGITTGNYYIYGVTNDGHGEVKTLSGVLTIYPPNQPPALSIAEPNGTDDTVVDGDIYPITYTLTDSNVDDTITVDFYYDTDDQNYNGIPITGPCSSAPEGTGITCNWNTIGLSPGTFYIYGITNGDIGGPVQAYSSGPVTVNTSNSIPALSILQPDGVDDTIIEGDNYAITYTLSDIDDVVTVAFYYDNDNSGLNGTPLAGACSAAPEGTGVNCTWDTTGMAAGSYYIYGITSGDRDSTIVARYSLGTVTINVNAPAVSSTAPDNGTTAIAPDSAVTITWDENVNCATVTTSSVTMLPSPISWTMTLCSGNQAVFTPSGQTDTTSYQVTVSTAVQDTEGNGMTAAHVFSYTTNNPPALNISVPDGSEDPQTAGNSFNIEYTLTDNDHEVTAALYYDTDTDMTGGQPIPGCEAVSEGSNLNCNWSGIPAGTYYIYGVSDDGVGSGSGGACISRIWNGSNNSFVTASNWIPNGTPQDGDDISFDGTSVMNSLWDTAIELTSLSLNRGYTGTVAIDAAITVSEDLVLSDGSMVIGTGSITVGGAPISCGGSSSYVAGPVTIVPAGITVTPTTGLVTTEAGGSDTFTIELNSQPTSNVTIGLSSSDLTEGTVSPASLTFTSANWNFAQTVTVTGVDDSLIDGDVIYTIITAPASSADAYNGIDADDISVTNNDNDNANIIVTPDSGLVTAEAGGADTFTVALASQPAADVIIGLSSSDPTEGTVLQTSLTFTSVNWNTPQTVTVTGVNDDVADGNTGYNIITATAVSADPEYSGVDAVDVSVTNNDDNTANIIVTPTSGLVTDENGATDTFTVALNSQPTEDVIIGLSSSNTAEGTVAPASLTFTAANWNTPQTVTVTGVDDYAADGSTGYSIVTAAAVSADLGYNGLNASDVTVTNNDNEVVGITVTPTSGLITDESGGTDTFTVVLTSPPAADVTIGISSSNTAEGTVSPASLTFTAGNWYIAQTVTVTGVNDSIQDGNIGYNIVTAAAVSGDPAYSGLNASDVSVTNTDNDVAGITVSPLSIITTEDSGVASFWVKLNSQPTADVTIGISSNDTTEGTVSVSSLTFTSANWNTKKFVTVTGVDDSVADGNIIFSIITAAALSADSNYSGLDAADVSVTNYDNDAVGITVTPTSGLATDESGGTATFTVVLNSEPASNVTIGISSADLTEGTVSPSSLIFTSGDWNTPQTVIVTGVDDSVQDGNIPYTIVTAAAVSADAYNGFNPDDVNVTNNDNDVAGVTVSAISGNTTEDGGTATFTVVLNSEPTDDVTIVLSSSDTTEGTVSPASVTVTSANWNTPQTVTVTGVDDFVIDGDIAYTIETAAAVSADTNYSGMNASDVSVTNNDNDVAGVTVSTISGNTTEDGGTATFTVVLDSEPTEDVIIGLSSSDTTEGTVSPASVTFTSANWNTPQTVTVTGVDDFVIDGDIAYTIETAAAVSADTDYNGLSVADISVTNIDDDVIGITVTPISGNTTEAGGTATFTVKLNSEPAEDVTIGISSDDTTEGTVSPASLTFTATNWNTPQTVTVTGVDDDVADGNITYTVITAAASSLDTNYNGLDASDVSVTNEDNDVAGVSVSAISGSTTEGGGTATFTIVLDSEPTADVTIGISSSNTAEGTVSPASVMFTTGNWNIAQTVTVTGVDDDVQDGNIAFSIITAQASSTDLNYNVIDPDDVSVTNEDNDVAGVTVSAISGNTTEAGGTATFTIMLDSEPTADVTIGISSGDLTEGTVSSASLIFDAGNWNVPQTVTVTGVNDFVDDGDQLFSIITAAAVSGDANYSAINPNDVSVINTDNDTAGIYVDPASGLTTSENGTQAYFSVTLESQPTADVTITLSSSNTDEGIITDPSPATLTFTPSNWDEPQWIEVTGVPDSIVDGNVVYQIITAPAASTDTKYSGMNAVDVSITNWNID